ncbi:MAG: hypothetical protein U0795_22080 [Pirellulales bacterium]
MVSRDTVRGIRTCNNDSSLLLFGGNGVLRIVDSQTGALQSSVVIPGDGEPNRVIMLADRLVVCDWESGVYGYSIRTGDVIWHRPDLRFVDRVDWTGERAFLAVSQLQSIVHMIDGQNGNTIWFRRDTFAG